MTNFILGFTLGLLISGIGAFITLALAYISACGEAGHRHLADDSAWAEAGLRHLADWRELDAGDDWVWIG